MYIIERLWVDPLENYNACGFELIGYATNEEDAIRISKLEYLSKKRWPLVDASGYKDKVPRFRTTKVVCLDNMTLDQLMHMGVKK